MSEARTTYSSDGRTAVFHDRMSPSEVSAAGEPGLSDLFRQLAEDSGTLVKQEIALAKMELKENTSRIASAAMWIPVWGAVALIGGLVLVAFLVILLGDILNNYWLSALIIGAVFTILGGSMAMSAVNKVKAVALTPETTIKTLKEDRTWAKSEVEGLKQDLKA